MSALFASDLTAELTRIEASDAAVIAAARVSTTGAEARTSNNDSLGLIRFLMRNRHGTPFEHNSFTFYVKAPIFVFREFHRHRIGWSYNEMSGRYMELPGEFYLPPPGRTMQRVAGTKTGEYSYEANELLHRRFLDSATRVCQDAWSEYQNALEAGVVPEVARMLLPVNTYSQMWATANARSIMAFLSLRTSRPAHSDDGEWAHFPSKPMWEIEQVADRIEAAFSQAMPHTHAAFVECGRVAP